MTIKAFVFDAYGTLYDVQSVSRVIDAAFPGHGEYITQVWRLKQLEYSWLRSLMGRYEDFLTVSRESLDYTLGTIVTNTGSNVGTTVQQTTNTAPGAVSSVSPQLGGAVNSVGTGAAQTVTGATNALGGLVSGLGGH